VKILESLPEQERVADTTVQTLVYRLEEKNAVRKVEKIGNAQLFEAFLNPNDYRSRLVRELPSRAARDHRGLVRDRAD